MVFFGLSFHTIEAGGKAVKTPGRGIVLTRFCFLFIDWKSKSQSGLWTENFEYK